MSFDATGLIYAANLASASSPSTNAFIQRGLGRFTSGRLSNLAIYGKPRYRQLAYSGYVGNIEAFLCATATKAKQPIGLEGYLIPYDYKPNNPLPLPQTVFSLAKPYSKDKEDKFLEKYASEGVQIAVVGGKPAYVVTRPSFRTLGLMLPQIAKSQISPLSGFSQTKASAAILHVYRIVDAFLATNTYSYKHNHFGRGAIRDGHSALNLEILENDDCAYLDGYESQNEEDAMDDDEKKRRQEHNVRARAITHRYYVSGSNQVSTAKPSPVPSRASWGSVAEVPNKGGILFPYFPGMISPDAGFIRDIVTSRFFFNFGPDKKSCESAIKDLRAELHQVVGTPQVVVLQHVLLGIDLALSTQSQCFLIFEGNEYQGFALLGEEFTVTSNGITYLAVGPQQLQNQLSLIATHETSLDAIARALDGMRLDNGDTLQCEATSICTPSKLADILAKIDISELTKDVEESLALHLGKLKFPGEYKRLSAENIISGIKLLTTHQGDPLPEDLHFFIPLRGWTMIGSREYKLLASFGPKAPSLRNAIGKEFLVPRFASDFDSFNEKVEGKAKYPILYVYEKPIKEAVKDWHVVAATGEIRMHTQERAASHRATTFRGEARDQIWEVLKEAAGKGVIRPNRSDPDASYKEVARVAGIEGGFRGQMSLDDFL